VSAEPTPTSAPPTKRRRRLRRALKVVAVLAVVVAGVVVLAPTIATSGFAERRISAFATDFLGVPVRVQGVEFGWRTPLAIEWVSVDGDARESALLVVEDAGIPLTLWEIVRPFVPGMGEGKLDKVEIAVGGIAANAVRDASGAWNFQRLLDKFAAKEPAPPEEEEQPTQPAPLPVGEFAVHLKRVDLRMVDGTRGLTTGIEGGSLDVLWPGGANPLTADVAGSAVVGEERMPWDIRAKIEHWADAQGMLTVDKAVATVSSDGMMGAHQIDGGGFFAHAGPPATEPAALRIVLPLADAARLANAAKLPVALRGIDGTVDIAVDAMPQANGDVAFDATFKASMAGGGEIALDERIVRIPAIDAVATAEGVADPIGQSLRSVAARIDHPGLKLAADARDVSAATPIPKEWTFAFDADFGELTRRASEYLGGENAPMVEATLSLDGKSVASTTAPLEGELVLAFAPAKLNTLEPATANPAFLANGPVDLSALKTDATVQFEADPATRGGSARLARFASPLVRDVRFSAEAADAGATWSTELGARAALDPLLAFARQFVAEIPVDTLAGDIALDAKAAQNAERLIASSGTVEIASLEARFVEPAWTYAEPRTLATWNVAFDVANAKLADARATFENGLLKADATMHAKDGGENYKLSGDADVDKIAALAATLVPLPGVAGGAVAVRAEATRSADNKIAGKLSANSTRDIAWTQEGLANFAGPVAFDSTFVADLSVAPVRSARASVDAFSVGDIVRLASPATLDLAESGDFAAEWNVAADHAAALAVVDEDVLTTRGLALAIEGTSTFSGRATGHLVAVENRLEGPVVVEGGLDSTVASVKTKFGEMEATLEEIADAHKFRVDLDPANPQALRAKDEATLTIGYLGLPFGAELAGFSATTRTEYDAASGVAVTLDPWVLEEGFVIGDALQAFVPKTTLAGRIAFSPATSRLEVSGLSLDLEKVGALRTTSSFDQATAAFATKTELSIPDLAAAVDLVTYESESFRMPTVSGGLRALADIAGNVPKGALGPTDPLPATGRMEIAAANVGVAMADGLRVEGFDAVASVDIRDEGRETAFASKGGIARVAHPALPGRPPESIAWDATAALANATKLDAEVREFAVRGYGFGTRGTLRVDGLKELLRESDASALSRALQNLRIDGRGAIEQDFAGLTGVVGGFSGEGSLNLSGSLRSRPGNRFEASALVDFADASFSQVGVARVEGLTGTWELGKTLLLSNDAKAPFALPPGRFDVRAATFGAPPTETTVRDMTISLQGFDDGLRADGIVRDLLGGAATATARLSSRDGDPTVVGRFQMTGVDMRRVGGGEPTGRDIAAEINAVGDLRWRLRATQGDRILEDLAASFATTRIGRIAMAQLLERMDPEGDSPGIQNALAALRFGKPVGADGQMNTSLVTFGGQLELPFGLRVDLPIVDRQPVSDLVDVYDIRDSGDAAKLLRQGLALLLSRTLAEFENNMNPRENAP